MLGSAGQWFRCGFVPALLALLCTPLHSNLVYFIVNHDDGFVGGVDVGEGFVDGVDLRLVVGVRDVDDMEEEVGFGDFVEGGFEGFNELRGELADEAYGVGEEEGEIADDDLADGGVEGGEEFVFCEYVGFGEEVEDGAFADVGVADEGHADEGFAVFALEGFLCVEFGELDFECRDFLLDEAAVGLDLCFAWSAHADAAALAFEMCPEASEAGEHVLELSELDLSACGGCACVACEDVEDESGAVEDAAFHFFLEVAELCGREFVVDDDDVGVEGVLVFAYFVEFARAYIGAGVGSVEFLDDLVDGDAAGGAEEEFEFVEVFLGTFEGLSVGADGDEDGFFGDFFVYKGVALLWRGTFAFLSERITEFAFLVWGVVHG